MAGQWKSIERYTYLGISVVLVIIVAISSISYQNLVRTQKDFAWVIRTREAFLNFSYFLSSLKNAEMGQPTYLLTGQEQYLEPYYYIEKGVSHHFNQLRITAIRNHQQQKRFDILEKLMAEKLAELKQLISLQADKDAETAKNAMLAGTGKQIMDEIQVLILKMDEDEKSLLDQRTKSIASRVKMDNIVKIVGIILIIITSVLVISRVKWWLAMREKTEKKQMDVVNKKSDFVSTASHELRTPLKAIKESLAIVLNESVGRITREQKKFLSITKRNIDRLANLINNVLDFQKLESGKMHFSICENNINEVIEEMHELMAQSAKKKGLALNINLDSRLPEIKFDRDKIIQVLTNIVDNAIKFTQNGSITVATDTKENSVFVSVQDTGPGIAEEDLPKLFRKFEQVPNTKHQNPGGSGLGLAICKEIITQHKGKIWAESEVDKGTTFWFILPVKERRPS